MRTSLLSVLALGAAFSAHAQCDQIFISEYVVGTGNNKAYELYNPTNATVSLANIVMERWSNGEAGSTDETQLVGEIPPYGTFVVVNGQTEDIDLGGFISPACDSALQALANQLDNPYPAPTFMNGNDALVLVDRSNGSEIALDIFGKPGEDPGEAWTAPDGTFITSGHTLIRKPSVVDGVTIPPVTFDPLAQWDTLAADTWTNLGTHECDCFVQGTQNAEAVDVTLVPTLISGDEPIRISANEVISEVRVYDITGKVVKTVHGIANSTSGVVRLHGLVAGTYIVNILFDTNTVYSTRVVKY